MLEELKYRGGFWFIVISGVEDDSGRRIGIFFCLVVVYSVDVDVLIGGEWVSRNEC